MSSPTPFQSLGFKRARSEDQDVQSDVDVMSVATPPARTASVSSASTRTRKRQRRALVLDQAHAREAAFIRRFNLLEYLGKQESFAKMDMSPSLADPCEHFSQFMQLRPDLFPDFKAEDWCFVRSNSLVQLNHLDRFNRPQHVMPAAFGPSLRHAASYVDLILELDSKIPFPSVGDLADVRYYGAKFPGVEYARMGYKTRREAHAVGLEDANRAWQQLMAGERVEPQLNRIGGRGKLAKRADVRLKGDKLDKGRLVMMTGHRDLLLNGVTEQLLTEAYKGSEYPVAIGQSWWHGGCEVFAKKFEGFQRYWCFDAKKFDASLPGWLIRVALNLLRGQFVDGMDSRYDAYWEFIYEGLVEAPMYLDNGMIFRRRDGSTSGHSFNTLVQSVCTLILGYAGIIECLGVDRAAYVFENTYIEGMGDDQLGAGKGDVAKLELEEIAEKVWRMAGVDWFGDKSFQTGLLVDRIPGLFQGIQFLGKYFYQYLWELDSRRYGGLVPYRPRDETLFRLLYPERMSEGLLGAWQRACGHYADSAGFSESRDILEEYLDWLEPQMSVVEFTWPESWRRKFTAGDPDAPPPPPARRISHEEWLSLVLN